MIPTTFAHVALNCEDPAPAETFYSRHFGFRRARVVELPDTKIVFLKSGTTYLELFRSAGGPPVAPPEKDGYPWSGVRHLAFQVSDVDAKLAEMGDTAVLTF